MKDFAGKLAVITGAGSGMGRELAKQLAAQGCHVAFCDVSAENMAETKRACEELAAAGTAGGKAGGIKVSSHVCDVSDERQVIAFRDAVKAAHATERIHLLFNNAGIGGGGSFLKDERAEWDRTFAVCWGGVYHCARAFMPMLVAADEACIVNTSSLNGFWACLGPTVPHTAYSTAKFAVKGFSEGLVVDLKVHAPHVKVALVMPGHIGTDIALNSRKVLGKPDPTQMDADEVAAIRKQASRQGMPVQGLSDDQLRSFVAQRMADFRDKAPLSAAAAATIILDGVREDRFRLLVGEDAKLIDQRVREAPDLAYDPAFFSGFGAARAR